MPASATSRRPSRVAANRMRPYCRRARPERNERYPPIPARRWARIDRELARSAFTNASVSLLCRDQEVAHAGCACCVHQRNLGIGAGFAIPRFNVTDRNMV
jgi:hypothetical protein